MTAHRLSIGFRFLAISVCLTFGVATAQTILYVNQQAKPGGNGSNWAAAFTTIPPAIAAAANPKVQEIWVAAGTYTPGAFFDIRDKLGVYGGFNGGESLRSQRNPAVFVTILDGANRHMLVRFPGTTTAAAVLDGFTITRGSGLTGGAIQTFNGSPTLSNLIIVNNISANDGGGVYTYSGSPTLTSVVFKGNKANAPVAGDGGAFYCYQGSPTFTHVRFENNGATTRGGAFYGYDANPRFTRCEFTGNTAVSGAAIWDYEGTVRATHCTFRGNVASGSGGAYSSHKGTLTFTNNLFAANRAGGQGGGGTIASGRVSHAQDTIAANRAATGGGLSVGSAASVALTNSVLWGNTATTGPQVNGSATITYSCVMGGRTGTGNTAGDPMFRSVPTGDFRIGPGSACTDAGDNLAVPTGLMRDLAWNTRRLDDPLTPDKGKGTAPIADLGAYELTHDFPGTGDDLTLRVGVGLGNAPEAGAAKAARAGQIVNIQLHSPNASFVREVMLLGIQVYPTSSAPRGVPGLSNIWVHPAFGSWIIFGTLPLHGFKPSLPIPSALPKGFSILVQGGVASRWAKNAIYATTDAVEIRIQ